jgi:hypothetical protein
VPRITYVERRFSAGSRAVIDLADAVCQDYAAQGFDLTLRQLYYQFISRDIFPEARWFWWNENSRKWIADPEHTNPASTKNADPNYKWLGSLVNDARLAGVMDWDHLVDRTRNLRDLAHWRDPESIIDAVATQYRTDRWAHQPYRVEVWVEKDALTGVIGRTAEALDVPWFSCRGYTSQSELWAAARRHIGYERRGQKVVVIHLGDHDPSGVDMTRDVTDRLTLFGASTKVVRIALNMAQIQQFQPPPNPAKLTDSRATGYIARYGGESWELDALDPTVLDGLIRDAVAQYRDEAQWAASTNAMEAERSDLVAVRERWGDVIAWLEARGDS